MIAVAALVTALWFADNAEFVATTEAQREDGYRWHDIDCREVDESLPNVHILSPSGKKYVCWKLEK